MWIPVKAGLFRLVNFSFGSNKQLQPSFQKQLLAMLLKQIQVKKSISWKRVITANNFHMVCLIKGFWMFWLQTFYAASNFNVKQSRINHQLFSCTRNSVKIRNHGIPIELPELRKAPFKQELSRVLSQILKKWWDKCSCPILKSLSISNSLVSTHSLISISRILLVY